MSKSAPPSATRLPDGITVAPEGEEGPSVVRRRLLLWVGGRLLLATLLLSGTVFTAASARSGFTTFTARWMLGMVVATFAMSILFAIWIPRTERLGRIVPIQVAWDMILTTGLVYVLGGASSGFSFLYGVAILAAALVVGPSATRVVGVVAVLSYLGLGVGVGIGVIPHPPDQPMAEYRMPAGELGFAIARNVVALVLVALLADNLAARVRRTGGRLRAAEASAAKLARLNADIIRSIHSGLVTTDASSVILTINPAALEIFRATEDAIVGKKLGDLLPGVGPPPALGSDNDGVRTEGEGIRPDGTRFPAGHTRTALVDERGESIGTLVVFQDLTEVNELRRVAEHAERLAAIGRLAAGLAHEIRNPLGSISGSVELVREAAELGAEDRRLLGNVINEVERLNDLVTTMLEVSRPRPPQRATVDLSSLVDDVVQMARRGPAIQFGVNITAEIPAQRVEVWADAGQLRQVLWNLLKNAIQATPRGRNVHVRVQSEEGGLASFEVADEGSGVAPGDRARLFDMFYSSRPQGTGLGLALAKQIVDGHGATIEVGESGSGGAAFRVRFPEPRAAARSSMPPRSDSNAPRAGTETTPRAAPLPRETTRER